MGPLPQGMTRELLVWAKPYYAGLFLLIFVMLLLNPFSGRNFGVLGARSESDLSVGGLLVGGILQFLLSALAVPLMLGNSILGGAAVGVSIWLMLNSGSKGIAAIYFVFVVFYLLRRGKYSRMFRSPLVAAVLLGSLILITPTLLVLANRVRAKDESVGLRQSMMQTVSRFTQQDVASVIQQDAEWRRRFQSSYILGNLLAFVPGFLFPGKPLNPAYEIDRLYGGPFTAASPSIFGGILIATGAWLYWPVLALLVYGLARMDAMFCEKTSADQHMHYEWYLIFACAMLFEANYVLWGVQAVVLFLWRKILRARESRIVMANSLDAVLDR